MLYFQLADLFCTQTDPTDFWCFIFIGKNFFLSQKSIDTTEISTKECSSISGLLERRKAPCFNIYKIYPIKSQI